MMKIPIEVDQIHNKVIAKSSSDDPNSCASSLLWLIKADALINALFKQ